jgi:transcriptional regulator with XRE-family HTH domain
MVLEVLVLAGIARKFNWFVEAYRRPDGQKWGGQDLENDTNGIVTRSYITNLRKDRIENPGYEKMAAIAKAMGFPPGLWFEDLGLGIQHDAE